MSTQEPNLAGPAQGISHMKPPRLDTTPDSPEATNVFKHWSFVFGGYLECHPTANDGKKLILLAIIRHLSFVSKGHVLTDGPWLSDLWWR